MASSPTTTLSTAGLMICPMVATSPLTVTSQRAINSSAFRREANPDWAKYL